MRQLFDTGIVDVDDAHQTLEAYYHLIADSIQHGWDSFQHLIATCPEQCLAFTSTTRANIVHNNIVRQAGKNFYGKEGVLCYPEENIFTVDFHGVIRLRFKKLDNTLKPVSISTIQQQEFLSQTLFGPSSTKVTAGYRLDKGELNIKDMHVVCWYNDSLLWNIQLPDMESLSIGIENREQKVTTSTRVVAKTTKFAKEKGRSA